MKLFMTINLIVCIFLNTAFVGYAILSVGILILFLASRLPLRLLLRSWKPILFIFLFLFILNCFILKDDVSIIVDINNAHVLVISWNAIFEALYIGLRIFLMITITTILTSTTKPLDLTLAIEDLLSPLKIVRFPVHIISTIISIAFRMIPTLVEEASRIMNAQASRGVDFKNGNFKDKFKSLGSLVVPLLVSSFQKAEDLAYAMDSRGYNPYNKRTRFRHFTFKFIDLVIMILGLGFAVIIYTQYSIHFIPSFPWIDQFI